MKDTEKEEIKWVGDSEKEKIAYEYLSDNMYKLKEICDPIINQKGLSKTDMNRDDLYSYAIKVMNQSLNTYKPEKSSFKTFLTGNLKKKFYTWTRDGQRGCRCNVLRDKDGKIVKEKGENGKERNVIIPNISFDAPSEDEIDLKEKIDSGFNIEKELGIIETDKTDKIQKYLNKLTKKQRRIGLLLSQGYSKNEIKDILHIKEKEFSDLMFGMKSYEKVSVLF